MIKKDILLKNNSGFMVMDFLFAMVLVMGFSAILFAITITLSSVEIVQYITFASARNYFAADKSPADQITSAKTKFTNLKNSSVLGPLFNNGWFVIDNEPPMGDHTKTKASLSTPYNPPSVIGNTIIGVSTHLMVPVLDFSVPFFGSTSKTQDGSGKDFTSTIGSYLGREVTQEECINKFVKERWNQIIKLNSAYNQAKKPVYYPFADDGC